MSLFPKMETYETAQPWVIWTYSLPDWLSRVLGRTKIGAECCICGTRKPLWIRMPRWGKVVDRGPHPARTAYLAAHRHPLQSRAPETWAWPLRNIAAHGDTLDILTDVAHGAVARPPQGTEDGP